MKKKELMGITLTLVLIMALIPTVSATIDVKIIDVQPTSPVTGEEIQILAIYNDTYTGERIYDVNWSGISTGNTIIFPDNANNGTITDNYTFASAGEYKVTVNVTNGTAPFESGEDNVTITVKAQDIDGLKIVPRTLNLKSHGVFTVFLTIADMYDVSELGNITVEGATPSKINFCMKDGGTYILKFNRQDLTGVKAGDEKLNVSGKDGKYDFEGNDSVRIINPGNGKEKNTDMNVLAANEKSKGKKWNENFKLFKNNKGKSKNFEE
jgi:hypothetical protein